MVTINMYFLFRFTVLLIKLDNFHSALVLVSISKIKQQNSKNGASMHDCSDLVTLLSLHVLMNCLVHWDTVLL